MADASLELLAGVMSVLLADAGVDALVSGRVYDNPPKKPVFPYVRVHALDPSAFDTDSQTGQEVQLGLTVQTDSNSRSQALSVASAVKDALHRQEAAFSLPTAHLVEMIWQTTVTRRDADGIRHEAVMSFQATLEDAA